MIPLKWSHHWLLFIIKLVEECQKMKQADRHKRVQQLALWLSHNIHVCCSYEQFLLILSEQKTI